MPRLALLLVFFAVAGPLFAYAAPLHSQEPEGAPGDYFWTFAPNGLLADGRVEQAVVLLVDPDAVTSAAAVDGSLRYGGPNLIGLTRDNLDQIPLLFAAAGFDRPGEQIFEDHRCRFWTAEGTPDEDGAVAVGEALGEAIAEGLSQLGVDVQPCERTGDSAAADVLIWAYGQSSHAYNRGEYYPDVPAFIDYEVESPAPAPGSAGGGQGGGETVSPPVTGSGGLLSAD